MCDVFGVRCGLKQHEHEFWYDVVMVRRNRGHSASTGLNPSHGPWISTYQTRIADYGDLEPIEGGAALAAYAELYGRVQRKLFTDFSAGKLPASLKKVYLQRYGIPARMFNGLRVSLEGKVSSVRETMVLRRDSLQRRIGRAELEIAKAVERGRLNQVHHKRRRLANLKSRLAGLEADVAAGRVRLCFGSKRLWRNQHDLEANGYNSHEEWLSDWRDARSDEFFVLGSRDETAGCQLCVANVADDGALTLRLRMPDSLAERHGKYLVIGGVRFAYGHDQVLAALQSNSEYAGYQRQHGEKEARSYGVGSGHQLSLQAGCQGMAGVCEHQYDGRDGCHGPAAWCNRRRFERRPSGGRGDRCVWKLLEGLAGAAGHLWQEHSSD